MHLHENDDVTERADSWIEHSPKLSGKRTYEYEHMNADNVSCRLDVARINNPILPNSVNSLTYWLHYSNDGLSKYCVHKGLSTMSIG